MKAIPVVLPKRTVQRKLSGYVVVEHRPKGDVKAVSKFYAHSTSAYAALGRLVQKDTLQAS